MLLMEWHQKVTGVEPRKVEPSLPDILRFSFGENYVVHMRDGRSFEDKSLEPVLSVMLDEFHVYNTTKVLRGGAASLFPLVELFDVGRPTRSDPLGQRGRRSMVVSVVTKKELREGLPPPDIECVVQQVREAVTMFSLTGEWDTLAKSNL
jgi:hypothetical protein